MDWQEHIERNPEAMLEKPVIRGTRITVELILERLGDGLAAQLTDEACRVGRGGSAAHSPAGAGRRATSAT